ncbi:MAG: OB-fold nucleic acid binding domain-containing protein [Nitrospiria bacterium]
MKRAVIGLGLCLIAWIAAPPAAFAGEAKVKSIETLYAGKDTLKGQRIQIKGKVVKVNTGIMGKNFFHLQDGSGKAGNNDLTVTTQDEVRVGDEVVVTGLVTVNRDFGAGYSYPLIVEDATVTKGAGR